MAGTVTVTYKRHESIKAAFITWLSSAGGAADGEFNMDGHILRIVTNPDGTDVPSALWDCLLNDVDGFDLAQTLLLNRSDTLTENVVPLINTQLVAYAGLVTVAITNAGNAKRGTITVYWR